MKATQTGVATLIVMFLLVAGVLFILTQSTEIVRNRSIDTAQDLDSSAALMLAESGMQRAAAIVTNNQTAGTFSASTCTGIATGAPFSVGRGTINYGSVVESPTGCTAGTCNTCTVTAIGTVGSTQRTLSEIFALGTVNGTTGRGTVVNMVLKNTYNVPAIALFNLGWRRQSHGGNANAVLTPCSTCTIQWNLSSSSGNPSDGGMGISVPIAANVFSETITQTLSKDRDYAEVGGLFPSVNSSTPVVIGSYWSNSGSNQTAPNTGNTGGTNSGVSGTALPACTSVSATSGSSTSQACTTWCTGADTLVFGFAGRSTSVAAEIPTSTPVKFNTTGTGGYAAQNVSMTRIVHFPNTDGSIGAASGFVYSEEWYAINPVYNSTNNVTTGNGANGVTTYTGAIVGVAGATLGFSGSGKINNNQTTGTISSVTGVKVCVGDTITDANLTAGTTVSSLGGLSAAGTCVNPGASGVAIVISQKANGNVSSASVNTVSMQATSTTAPLSAGTAKILASGTNITISSGPDGSGVYTLSAATTIASGYIVQGTGLSTTVKVAAASELPATTGTIVNVYSTSTSPVGSGALAAQTTVTAIDSVNKTFTLSAAPTTAIIGAKMCGGICALFNEPSSTTSSTVFTVSPTLTSQWSGGFMCLSGVVQDASLIIPVTSSSITKRTWSEAIQ